MTQNAVGRSVSIAHEGNMPLARAVALLSAITFHVAILLWVTEPKPAIVAPQTDVIEATLITPPSLAPKDGEKPAAIADPPAVFHKAVVKAQKIENDKAALHWQKKRLKPVAREEKMVAASQKARPETISKPVFDAAYLLNVPPPYPPAALRRHMEGKVLLKVEVSAEGKASNVGVAESSGFDMLDTAARKAVESWKFVPAKMGSQNVPASVIVPVIFKIQEEP